MVSAAERRFAVALIGLGLLLGGCAETPQPSPSSDVTGVASIPAASATAVSDVPPWMSIPQAVADLGSRPGATGATVLDDGAEVVAYVVSEGDTASDIASRFDVGLDQLLDEDANRLGIYPTIYPGDRIQFGSPLTGADYDCFAGRGPADPGTVGPNGAAAKGKSCYDR